MSYIPNSFDEAYYLAQNPDVAAAVAAGLFTSGLQHYEISGAHELRNPNAYFDEQYYLFTNPDVAAAVASGIFSSGLEHFEKYGKSEDRAPKAGVAFDEAAYLAAWPDVAAAVQAGAYASGWDHYVAAGAAEGRMAVPPSTGEITSTVSGSVTTLSLDSDSGAVDLTASKLLVDGGAGLSTLHLTGDADVRIDFTNPNNQLRGIDLNTNAVIAANGIENNVSGAGIVTVKNFEIVDAYARDPLNETDHTANFAGAISYDGTGFAGDGVSTDGNIFLGGLGADTAFGGIGNDFLAGGGVGSSVWEFKVVPDVGPAWVNSITGLVSEDRPNDQLHGGRNADFMFAELSALDNTDGNGTLFDGGSTADTNPPGDTQSSQDSDWILVEASDDNEPVTVKLQGKDQNGKVIDGSITLSSTGSSTEQDAPAKATLIDIENVDASGNLYGFLNDVDVELGGRRLDDRVDAPVAGTENFGIGSTGQMVIAGSDANNIIIAGYDNDAVTGGNGSDLLFGGNLSFLLNHQNNPNLLDANGGLDLNVNAAGVVNDGRDSLDGGNNDDGIVFEMDGGVIDGGADDGTTSADTAKDTGDTLYVTNFSMGRLQGATVADEGTAQADALDAMTKDSTVRFDLGNTDTAVNFRNYGGSNLATQDQTNYVTGVGAVTMKGMESVITTGLGGLDYVAAGTNDPELQFNNQQNFLGLNADVDLRGNAADNTLYANTGDDMIEGRGGDDNLSGGTGDDDFVFAIGDGVDVIHRQQDADGNNLWDRDAQGNGLFVQDFRAPQAGDINASHLVVDFGATDLTSVNVAVTQVRVEIGGTVFSVNIPLGTHGITNIATLVNDAFSAQDADVSVTSINNTLVISDSQGRDISDTVDEGYLVAGAVSNGTLTTTATLTPGGQAINIVEDDRLLIKTYEARAINLGKDETTLDISNAAAMVVKFDVGADKGTVIAQGQQELIRLTDVNQGDTVSVTINGKVYSYTAKLNETSQAVATALVGVINRELDLNSGSGQVTAKDAAGVTEFKDTDDAGTNVAVISLSQALVGGSQVYMDVSVTVSNTLTGNSAGKAELHNQSATSIDLYGFDGRNGNLSGEDVLFVGRGTSTVSLLQTALNAGETLTGKDATIVAHTDKGANVSSSNKFDGINGDDLLIGGDGNDVINGGTGDDVIVVSKGTDTVDGGGSSTASDKSTIAYNDVLLVDQSTFGTGSKFTVALDGTLGAKGAGTVTVGGTATGTTTFTNIETVRVLDNSRDTTLDVKALSDSVAAAVGTNAIINGIIPEGLTVNLTRTTASVTYSIDGNNSGGITAAPGTFDKATGDYNAFVATQVYGAENVTTGNANDTVNIDASQITANNVINLGGQQDNTTAGKLAEGGDSVVYDHTFLTTATDRPTITVAVETATDTDTVSMTGGVLGTTVTKDTLISAEKLTVTNAALGSADTLDVSALTAGATVNYGAAITVGKSLGGQVASPTTVAGIDANTLASGGVATTGTGLGTEKIEITGITALEHVTGSAGDDRVVVADAMGGTADTTKLAVASYLGAAGTVDTANNLRYQFDLAGGSNDIVDYRQETGVVAVVVNYGEDKDSVIVDSKIDGNLTDVADHVDLVSNVERYFASTGASIIDLSAATGNTTVQFSAETKANGNEFFDPNGRPNPVVDDQVRGITVSTTADNTVLAHFMDADAGVSTAAAYWNVVQGSDFAERVNFTNHEDSIAETLNLSGGANVVSYAGLTKTGVAVSAIIEAGSDVYFVTPAGGAQDVITIDRSASHNGALTLIATNETYDTIINSFAAPTHLDGNASGVLDVTGSQAGHHLIDLANNQVIEDVSLNVAGDLTNPAFANNVTTVQGFENAIGGINEDWIFGNASANSLDGAGGNDIISGGGGADTLSGGFDADRFVYGSVSDGNAAGAVAQAGADTIGDFDALGNDVLVVDSSLFGSLYQKAAGTVHAEVKAVATNAADLETGNTFLITTAAASLYTAADVATAIGTVGKSATGAQALFVVGNGTDAGVYAFKDVNGNGTVDSGDLTLLSTITGQGTVANGADAAASFTSADMVLRLSGQNGQQTITTANSANNDRVELVYNSVDQSKIGFVDNVTNFNHGVDKIDLSAFNLGSVSQDAIADIRTAAGNNTGTDVAGFFFDAAANAGAGATRGVVVESFAGGNNTRVFVDVNHDGNFSTAQDLVIDLAGANVGLTASDFIFV